MAAAAKKRPAPISQVELRSLRLMKNEVSRHRREMEQDEAWIKQKETDLLERLGAGARVEVGAFSVGVEQAEVCNPSYKDELVAHFQQAHGLAEEIVCAEVRKRWRKTVDRVVVVERQKVR